MKKIHVMECSIDGKYWFRIWAMNKVKCVGNPYRHIFYKYRRCRTIVVNNHIKLESIL